MHLTVFVPKFFIPYSIKSKIGTSWAMGIRTTYENVLRPTYRSILCQNSVLTPTCQNLSYFSVSVKPYYVVALSLVAWSLVALSLVALSLVALSLVALSSVALPALKLRACI